MIGRSLRAVNRTGVTNTTTRRQARLRRSLVRILGPALVLILTVSAAAVPAPAAAPTAGATWSKLMYRKLGLGAEAARLRAALPGLRTAAATRHAELGQAQKAQTTAATARDRATAADEAARAGHAAAKTAAAAAKRAVSAAKKRRPRSNSRIAAAKRALTAANATVQTRAAAAAKTAAALKTAHASLDTAAKQVGAATTAYQAATKAITDTQQRIASLPELDAALAAQAASIRQQVVTQSRASFTMAHTTQVYGITVNKVVAYPFQRMIDDAAKAGIKLSGGGFRTKQQQIRLRKVNGCPDIWTAPASSCRVPTAIPGRSLHEVGLAVDLRVGGRTIKDRRSAAFKWLARNAGRYGFVNLPSEPWHWSINGH
jgi:D-alanyl-D-alanine carboxypeptidase